MSWEAQLKDFKAKTEKEAERKFRAAILTVMIGVIMDTPVLEGRLRASWQAYIGTYAQYAGRADPTGRTAIASVTALVMGVNLDDEVYFVNTMPYAYAIEYEAYSQKAPAGMLRKNLARWKNAVEGSDETA